MLDHEIAGHASLNCQYKVPELFADDL